MIDLFVSRVLENIWDFARGLCQGTQGEEMTVKTLTYQENQKELLGRFLLRYIVFVAIRHSIRFERKSFRRLYSGFVQILSCAAEADFVAIIVKFIEVG